MHGVIVPSLKDYEEQINVRQIIPVGLTTIQRVFKCEEFGRNMAIKFSLVVIEEKVEDISVLWIAKILLSFSIKEQADRSEKKFAFFQYMNCTRALVGIEKELG